jgi:hypothetical protein
MQSLDPEIYSQLRRMAKDRGITMQELIRAVIVPDWMRKAGDSRSGSSKQSQKASRRMRRARPAISA